MSDSLPTGGHDLGVIVDGIRASRHAEVTDPGHGTPVISGRREPAMGQAASATSGGSKGHEVAPQALEVPITLVTRTGSRYRLVAGGPSDGVIVPCPGAATATPHARLVLTAEERGLENVQVVLQVLGPARSAHRALGQDFGPEAVAVRWLTLTATRQRAQLVAALQRMLSVDARVCVRDDVLGPHRKLVYNPARRHVSLVTVGAEAMPKRGREQTPTPSVMSGLVPTPDPRTLPGLAEVSRQSPSTRKKRATRPFVLVDNAALPEVSRSLLKRTLTQPAAALPPYAPAAGPANPEPKTMLSPLVTQRGYERVPTAELAAPGPVVKRTRARGCYTVGGYLRGMSCGWIGRTHVVFETASSAEMGLKTGDVVSVGVPGGPLSPNVIWVVGEVCRVESRRDGAAVVEVDLRRTRSLPEVYESLVAFWEAQSDASST